MTDDEEMTELESYNAINNEKLSKRIPSNYAACPMCKGKGYYWVNAAFDDSYCALSSFHNSERVTCRSCHGKGYVVSKEKTDQGIYFRNPVELIG